MGAVVGGVVNHGPSAVVISKIELDATEALYLGASDTDGSWRVIRSGNNLLIQRRESGNWVTKSTINA